MSGLLLPEDERILDLLAARATQGLATEESEELERLVREHAGFDDSVFDLAAAAIDLALWHADPVALPPPALRSRLDAAAQRWSEAAWAASVPDSPNGSFARINGAALVGRSPASRFVQGAGWLVAAVCLLIAVLGWWPRLVTVAPPQRLALAQQRESLLACPATVTATWADWDDPEITGVGGDVVWCERDQRGFMRFRNLPRNDPAHEQYQMWIVDERGLADAAGQSARISGAVFDGGPGEIIVPFEAPMSVGRPELFAVTIERTGGTWVSDMKRRVVVARVR